MKSLRTYKKTVLVLALMFFVNSIGFSIDVHLCEGEVYSFSFFGKAETCEKLHSHKKEVSTHECCKSHKNIKKANRNSSFKDKRCCSNQQTTYKVTSDVEQVEKTTLSEREFLISIKIFQLIFVNFEGFNSSEICWIDPPPLVQKDLSVLYQVFRI